MGSSFRYNDELINYSISRSKRKTIGISVSVEKGVHVTAPKWVVDTEIAKVIEEKASWIYKKLLHVEKIRAFKKDIKFDTGESFLYLGQEYCLNITNSKHENAGKISLCGKSILVTVPNSLSQDYSYESIKSILTKWYINQASELYKNRLDYFASQMHVTPSYVTIRGQKRRWGSCSGANAISLNWKLIMAPLPVIDYVIVHELAHIKIKDHSSRFWQLVESVLPDYSLQNEWLKNNGYKLGFD